LLQNINQTKKKTASAGGLRLFDSLEALSGSIYLEEIFTLFL